MSKQNKPDRCSCGKGFDCARCGKRVYCDPDANLHPLKICRRCCVKEGIKAIYAQQAATTTAALTAPRELAIRQSPRIGMTERGATEEIIMDAWASGRLTDDVYDARMAAAAQADSQADLDVLTTDLRSGDPGPITRQPVGDRALVTLVRSIPPFWILMIILAIAMLAGH